MKKLREQYEAIKQTGSGPGALESGSLYMAGVVIGLFVIGPFLIPFLALIPALSLLFSAGKGSGPRKRR